MRILYVEDNEVNQALVERVLRAKQCSVVFREEGEGALEVLAADSEIDLILLDIELAGAMSGLDVIRAMRARNDKRPVVAITAYAMMGDRERFLEAGCDQYLPKPLVITDLLNLLDHYEADFAAKAASVTEQPKAETVVSTPETAAAPAQPAVSEATPAQPAASEAAPAQPVAGEAAPAQPATSETTPAQPAASEATPAQPAASDSAGSVPPSDGAVPAAPAKTTPVQTEAVPVPTPSTQAAESANPPAPKDGSA